MRVGVGHAQGHVPLTGHPGAVLMTREVPHPPPSPSHPWRRGVVVVQRHDPAEPLRGQGIITSIGLTDTFNSSCFVLTKILLASLLVRAGIRGGLGPLTGVCDFLQL